MAIRSIGDFAAAARMLRTYYRKDHSGAEITGTLAAGNHVRFFGPMEEQDHIARYGFSTREGVGSFVGERYSADLVREVVNHPSNPLGFEASALPYSPTDEDGQDCKVVAGLWNLLLDIWAKLSLTATPGPLAPKGPTAIVTATLAGSPDSPRLKAYQAYFRAVESALLDFDKEIPAEKGGKYAQAGRDLLGHTTRAAIELSKALAGTV